MSLSILQVNTKNMAGGAERIVWDLHQYYRSHGYDAWMAVGEKTCHDDHVLKIPNLASRSPWSRWVLTMDEFLFGKALGWMKGVLRLRRAMDWIAEPVRQKDIFWGTEDFEFPGTWKLLDIPPVRPNILHCHNLHGHYFDLRAMPWLSKKIPIILTLHDAWLLSGHCAHSFECDKWKTGCERCPDLSIYPAIKRDATPYNWARKREIFQKGRFNIATPSHWLMEKVKQSILVPAIAQTRVIPNAVDLKTFHPGDQERSREILQIPKDANILLFIGNRIKTNPFKDFSMLKSALQHVKTEKDSWLLCLGEKGKEERIGRFGVRFLGYQENPQHLADYYRAADLYIHPAKTEVWGLTITEALACGTPVLATATGGIPEQIKGLRGDHLTPDPGINPYSIAEATGILTPPGDAESMAYWIDRLMNERNILRQMGKNAALDAQKRFDLKRMATDYLDWYQVLISDFSATRKVH